MTSGICKVCDGLVPIRRGRIIETICTYVQDWVAVEHEDKRSLATDPQRCPGSGRSVL